MDCAAISYSGHAIQRMFTRSLGPADVAIIVRHGDVIEDYPDDFPYPSCLVLGRVRGNPVHVVAARDPENGNCIVVTVYVPDPTRWSADFRTRRRS